MYASTVYVRARDHARFRELVGSHGSQASLAARIGISTVRISQLMNRPTTSIPVALAAALEDALHAERGELFGAASDAALVAPYLSAAPDTAAPDADTPDNPDINIGLSDDPSIGGDAGAHAA